MTELMDWLVFQVHTNPGRTWAGLLALFILSIYFLWFVVLLESNGFHYSVEDFDEPTDKQDKPNRNEDKS